MTQTSNIDFSLGGLILDYTISSYKGIAVFQLVINGVGGNLVAVQASRISTSLHKDCQTGVKTTPNVCISPFHAFFAKGRLLTANARVILYSHDRKRNKRFSL